MWMFICNAERCHHKNKQCYRTFSTYHTSLDKTIYLFIPKNNLQNINNDDDDVLVAVQLKNSNSFCSHRKLSDSINPGKPKNYTQRM